MLRIFLGIDMPSFFSVSASAVVVLVRWTTSRSLAIDRIQTK
jgi:hypothetical protein